MASIAMMIGGALANALAFSGSSYLFSALQRGDLAAERKRHDLAVERLNASLAKWQEKRQERIDYINKRILEEKKSEAKFTELNDAMREYHELFGEKSLPSRFATPLPPKLVLSDYYKPSENQHFREIAFIALSMGMIGATIWYFEK